MTIITVVVESTFSGPASGFHGVRIDDSKPVKELIREFCNAKEAVVNPNYTLITKNNVLLVNKRPISDFLIQNGQVLKLISRKDDDSKLLFRQWITMASLGLFVAIAGLATCVLLFAVYGTVPDNYAMVIDASSGQTNFVLFSWLGEKRNNTGEVIQVSTCSSMGGLMQVDPNKMNTYFDSCFDELYKLVLKDSNKDAEVFFGATEDIQFFNKSNPVLTRKIIEGVQKYLRQSKWKYGDSNERLLLGLQEGVSQWISVNYLEETILEKGTVDDTFGTLNLDDAIANVAFKVIENSINSPDLYPITLFGNKFNVFSQSHMCYGKEEALRRYRALLLIEHLGSEENSNITSPCEPLDWIFEASNSDFSSVCVGIDLINSEKNSWNFIGSGNYSECERVVSKLLNYAECSNAKLGHCVDPTQIHKDIVNHDFYAYSAYSSIAYSLGLAADATLLETRRHIKVMCDYSMEQLDAIKAKLKNQIGANKDAFEQYCFQGQYMFGLLTQVYGFNSEEKWDRIVFATENVEWPLGYMINATQEITPVPRVPKLKLFPFSLLTLLFLIFIFLSIAFAIHGFKIRKDSQGYQRF